MPNNVPAADIPQIVMANAALARSLCHSLIVSATDRNDAVQITRFVFEKAKEDLQRFDPRGAAGAREFLDHQLQSILDELGEEN